VNNGWIARAKRLMTEQGLTQVDLAKAMDVKSSGAVSHYFTSLNEPTVKQLNNLAKLLKVKPQYLLYGDNSLNSKLITQCSSIVRDLNIQNEMGLSEEQQVQLVIYVYNQSLKENRVEMLSEEQIIDTANLLLAV
jgi:transcriptional regulator with XRE-family HTH domain